MRRRVVTGPAPPWRAIAKDGGVPMSTAPSDRLLDQLILYAQQCRTTAAEVPSGEASSSSVLEPMAAPSKRPRTLGKAPSPPHMGRISPGIVAPADSGSASSGRAPAADSHVTADAAASDASATATVPNPPGGSTAGPPSLPSLPGLPFPPMPTEPGARVKAAPPAEEPWNSSLVITVMFPDVLKFYLLCFLIQFCCFCYTGR